MTTRRCMADVCVHERHRPQLVEAGNLNPAAPDDPREIVEGWWVWECTGIAMDDHARDGDVGCGYVEHYACVIGGAPVRVCPSCPSCGARMIGHMGPTLDGHGRRGEVAPDGQGSLF